MMCSLLIIWVFQTEVVVDVNFIALLSVYCLATIKIQKPVKALHGISLVFI